MRKRKILKSIIFSSIFIILGTLMCSLFVTFIYGRLKSNLYLEKIESIQSYSKVFVDSLSITKETLEMLKEGDDSLVKLYDSKLSNEIYVLKKYNLLSEELKNVEIYSVNNNSSAIVYKYDRHYSNLEYDRSFFNRNDTEMISELADDKFMTIVPLKLESGLKIGSVKITTLSNNYLEKLDVYADFYKVSLVLVFVIGTIILINKYISIYYECNIDNLTGFVDRLAYKNFIKKIITKNPYLRGELLVIGFKDIENYDNPNIELIEEVIFKFSQILKKYKRHNVLLARVSEQKLGIYVHNIAEEDSIRKDIIKDVEDFLRTENKYRAIQYYIGLSYYPVHEKNVDALVNGAIYVLEKLKKEKKQFHTDNFMIYDPKAHREYIDKEYLYDEVTKIIKERKVYNVFQPIVNLRTGEIFGYEALSRPISDLVPNIAMLIELSDEMNISADLEKILLYQTNKTVYKMRDKFADKHLFLNTNVSIKYGQEEMEKFKYIIEKIVNNLVIEITEYNKIDFDTITEKIDRVKGYGAMIAIDDFGTGYSNELALLSLFPDIIKIDMELMRDIDKDSRKFEIVKNLTEYAKNNNIRMLAEGVETPAELKVAADLDIDFVQGYIFAKPEKELLEKTFDVDLYLKGKIS